MRGVRIALLLVVMSIVPAGCGNGTPVAAPPTTGSTPSPGPSATGTPTAPRTASPTTTAVAPSGLLAMTLTDVHSGESFSLAQFDGKVTIVQHMAVW